MAQNVHTEDFKAVPTAVVRGCPERRELSKFVPAACGEVWAFIRAAGLPRPGRHVALYFHAPWSVEVGAEMAQPFNGSDRVHCSELPAGRVATAAHFGPYSGLSEAHAEIQRWCAEQGHRLADVSWEIYGHWKEGWNANPSKIRTDVYYLLRE